MAAAYVSSGHFHLHSNVNITRHRYEILSDPEKREHYDHFGLEGIAGQAGVDPNDIFAEVFGGFSFFGGGAPRKPKGKNSTIPYDVTLEDLYNGKQVKMNMERDIICGLCNGSGAKGNAKPKNCLKCDGKGFTIVTTPVSIRRWSNEGAYSLLCSAWKFHVRPRTSGMQRLQRLWGKA